MAVPVNDDQASKLELSYVLSSSEFDKVISLDVPFPSARQAAVALGSLSPDREPRRGGVHKRLTLTGSVLNVKWRADEARVLRVSVNSFLDHLSLVLETMHAFSADACEDPHAVLGRQPPSAT